VSGLNSDETEVVEQFNEKQIEAIEHENGPALLIAGAGTGKTRTLMHRFLHLWDKGLAWPYDMCVLTFSVTAADEFRQRLQIARGYDMENVDKLAIRTFHGHCRHILFSHMAGKSDKQPRVFAPDRAFRFLRQAMKEVLQGKESPWSERDIMRIISDAKELGVGPDEFADTGSRSQAMIAQVFRRYQALLEEDNGFDFADLIGKTIALLETTPELLAQLWEQHPFVMVDEGQDTSLRQGHLLSLLVGPQQNILLSAAPAQEIYRWRNTHWPKLYAKLQEQWPEIKTIVLPYNYRSNGHIVKAAACVLDTARYADAALTPVRPDGDRVKVVCMPNEQDEAVYVAEEAQRLLFNADVPYKEMAVLARTGGQLSLIEKELLARGIPRDMADGEGLYDRAVATHLLAYLALAGLPDEQNERFLETVINTPPRGIGPVSVKNMKAGDSRLKWDHLFAAMTDGEALKLRASAIGGVKGFYQLVLELQAQQLTPAEMIDYILTKTGYWRYLNEQIDGDAQMATVREVQSEAEQYVSISELIEAVRERQNVDTEYMPGEGIQLATIHAVKGREYRIVWMIGCERGLLPHSKAKGPEQEEGERRLCHVGMTRAREQLYMLYTEYRHGAEGARRKSWPSLFLRELPAVHVERLLG
jgi:DNA helicase-2/ATP-dependent DNA helicase PcrA